VTLQIFWVFIWSTKNLETRLESPSITFYDHA
jgi:hypothetical protein